MFNYIPRFSLTATTLSTTACSSFGLSSSSAILSAKHKLLTCTPHIYMLISSSSRAVAIINLKNILKSSGERMHPCNTPIIVLNWSLSSPQCLIDAKLSLEAFCTILMIFLWVPVEPHCFPKSFSPNAIKCLPEVNAKDI